MEIQSYLSRDYFDAQRSRYRPAGEVKTSAGWVKLKTEQGQMLKLFYGLEDTKELTERLEWLCGLGKTSVLRGLIAFPGALLMGLKRGEAGYMYAPSSECDLNGSIHLPKGEKLFKWYCDKTGGIAYRLKIGYAIADSLQKIHSNGFCLVDICPGETHLQPYVPDSDQSLSIQFTGADHISSYTHHSTSAGHPGYRDPLVFLHRSGVSTASDTYSFAVMLFELLTTCHPFRGEAAETLSDEEAAAAIDSGALGYIGSDPANLNEIFEDTRIFLPKELASLFERTFTVGRLDTSQRPALGEWKAACVRSLKRFVTCDHVGCGREYPYNSARTCPFCAHPTKRIITARVRKMVVSSAKLLLPYDEHKSFTALPTAQEEVNFMVIHPGLNQLTGDFFDPDAKSGNSSAGILLQYSPEKGKIAILNYFTRMSMKVGGEILAPYSKADRGSQSNIIVLPVNQGIIIELPDNAQITPERIVPVEDSGYGDILHKWVISIE